MRCGSRRSSGSRSTVGRRAIKTIVGLDLSFSATGFAATRRGVVQSACTIAPPKTVVGKLARINWIADELVERCDALQGPVEIYVEDFAFSQPNRAHDLGGLGYIVRMRLIEAGYTVFVVPIAVNKKFCTGRGNAKKRDMILDVFKKWGVETRDDNVADAISLSMLGTAMQDPPTNDLLRKAQKTIRREEIQ